MPVFIWWARRDSNPQALRQRILSPQRIPVPPLALEARTRFALVYRVLQTLA
jgi:hypothetical protein